MFYTDREHVAKQYRDASNLNARIALHERFSTNKYGWHRWVFDQFALPGEARILDVGCGPGRLWTENLDRVPDGWHVSLTDASPGMVREAEGDLAGSGRHLDFRVADAQELPFESGSFDAVVANHMLYHVPDRPKALSEISRVLRPGGTLYAATNGQKSQKELREMLRRLNPDYPAEEYYAKNLGNFSLENGTEQLSTRFSQVSLRRYEDALVVTESKPLMDYVLSGTFAQDLRERLTEGEFRERTSGLAAALEQELASRGAIRITKDAGLFVARV